MSLLADASVDLRLVRRLRALGVEVQASIETAATALDPDVLAKAHAGDLILLTEDKGFGDPCIREGPAGRRRRLDPRADCQ